MTLNPTQLDEVIEKYSDRVIDETDIKAVEQLFSEMMVDSFSAVYGEEYWQELVRM